MKSFDEAEKLASRESYLNGKFAEKFADQAKAMDKTVNTDMMKVIGKLSGDEATAFNQIKAPYDSALTSMEKIADFGPKGWVKKEGSKVTDDAFKTAQEAYNKASESVEKFFAGTEKVKISGKEIEASDALKKAYAETQAATKKVSSVMNHPFGMVKVEGAGFAAKHNLNKFHFSAEKRVATSTKDLAIRGGGMAIGAAMTIDALARGKDKEGEPRGGYTRLLEGLAGLGLVGGSVLAGHAR